MGLVITSPPVIEPVTVEECFAHLRLDVDPNNTSEINYLSSLISTARIFCEQWQGRSYIARIYEYVIDSWPHSTIELPMPPVIEIESVYCDSTIPNTHYLLDTSSFIARLSPITAWPKQPQQKIGGITITYVAGYGYTRDDVPQNIRHAIMMLVSELYENREDTDKFNTYTVPWSVKTLLGHDRIISI